MLSRIKSNIFQLLSNNFTNKLTKTILIFVGLISLGNANELYSNELHRINANNFITILESDDSNNSFNLTKKQNQLMSVSENRVDFLLDKNNLYNSFLGRNSVYLENFPIGESRIGNLRLYSANPAVDENTVINIYYQGQIRQEKAPDFKIYSGTIDGDTESDVILIVSKNGLNGILQTGLGKQYNVGLNILNDEKTNYIQSNTNNQLHTIVLNDRNELEHRAGITETCGVSDKEQNPYGYDVDFNDDFDKLNPKNEKNNGLQATSILQATIAMEGNHEFFLMFKRNTQDPNLTDLADNEQAIQRGTEYMIQVMSMSSLVYQRELNITLKIGNIDFYADRNRDPYYSLFNQILSAKLNRMRSAWSSRGAIKRTVVSLFTNLRAQPANSTIAGIAYVGSPRTGVLCNTNQGYNALGMIGSFMYPTMNFTTDVNVTAHELGHNFSSPHTHNCYFQPQIDTCLTQETNPNTDACIESGSLRRLKLDGDIMSYCFLGGGSILKFHPRIKDLIRSAATKANGNCISIPTVPTLQLVHPKGQEKFVAGDPINIAWNVANVNRIKISFSSNGGTDWQNITNDVSAVSDSIFKWTAPNIGTKNAFIKIEDLTNPSVSDISITPFEIQTRELTLNYPEEGQEIGYSAPIAINWSKSAIDDVRLRYSTNGGADWITIFEKNNLFTFSYDFPDIATDNAVLRIESVANPNIFSETNFKVGMEKVEFLSPDNATVLCDTSKTIQFVFKSNFSDRITIWVSFDGKENWRRSHIGWVNALNGIHQWTSSSIIASDQVYVKATPFGGSNDLVIGEVGPFIIDECSPISSVEDLMPYYISDLSPNPANDILNININQNENISNISNHDKNFTLKIINISGEIVKSFDANYILKNISNSNNNGTLQINVNDLPQGNYIVSLVVGELTSNKNLRIIKK